MKKKKNLGLGALGESYDYYILLVESKNIAKVSKTFKLYHTKNHA